MEVLRHIGQFAYPHFSTPRSRSHPGPGPFDTSGISNISCNEPSSLYASAHGSSFEDDPYVSARSHMSRSRSMDYPSAASHYNVNPEECSAQPTTHHSRLMTRNSRSPPCSVQSVDYGAQAAALPPRAMPRVQPMGRYNIPPEGYGQQPMSPMALDPRISPRSLRNMQTEEYTEQFPRYCQPRPVPIIPPFPRGYVRPQFGPEAAGSPVARIPPTPRCVVPVEPPGPRYTPRRMANRVARIPLPPEEYGAVQRPRPRAYDPRMAPIVQPEEYGPPPAVQPGPRPRHPGMTARQRPIVQPEEYRTPPAAQQPRPRMRVARVPRAPLNDLPAVPQLRPRARDPRDAQGQRYNVRPAQYGDDMCG